MDIVEKDIQFYFTDIYIRKRLTTITALNVFIICLVIIMFFLDEEGAFKKFTHFGPSDDIHFLNMKVNTGLKLIIVYVISFLTAFLTQFFRANVTAGFFNAKLVNHAVTELDVTRGEAKYLIWTHPIAWWVLAIIQFMITLTMQLQFMLFSLVGSMFAEIPFYLSVLSEKKTKKN
jgi:uncharacterized membrane protein